MNKLKGKFAAVKMKYLFFIFVAALLVSLPTRVYQLLLVVDVNNGFYNNGDITVLVLYGALAVFSIAFLVLSFLSKEVPSPKLPVGKNPVLGIGSAIMAAGLCYDIFSIESKVIPHIEGDFNLEIFTSLFSSNLEQNGGLLLVLRFLFALFAIFYFVIFTVSHLNGKASYKEYKILAVAPVGWACVCLVSRLMTAVSFLRVSELLFEIFMFVFGVLFLLVFARISSGVFTENSMWGIYGYGFGAALFAGLATIPRIVCLIAGASVVEGYEFNFSYLAMMIFIITYIIASLGVGFKDGLKNMKTIAEVELPDEDTVVKKGSTSSQTISASYFDDEDDTVSELDVSVVEEPVVDEEAIDEKVESVITEIEMPEIEEPVVDEEVIDEEVESAIAEIDPEIEEITEIVVETEPEVENVVEEPIVETVPQPAPASSQKVERSIGLFGSKKGKIEEESDDDLKPISLADLKKMRKTDEK